MHFCELQFTILAECSFKFVHKGPIDNATLVFVVHVTRREAIDWTIDYSIQ